VLSVLAATGFALAIPWTVKQAIDTLQHGGGPVGGHVVLIVVLAVANGVARLGSRFAIVGAAQRVEGDLREALYASFQAFPPEIFARYSTGDLMARATSDVSAVRSLVGFGAVSLVSTALAFAGAIAAMLVVDPWLTLWAMGPLPVLVGLARQFNTGVSRATEAMQQQLGILSGRVQETLAGIAVVRAYTLEPRVAAAFAAENAALLDRSVALAAIQARFTPLMSLIAGVGVLIVLWVGGHGVAEGRLTLGALVAFMGYLAYLAWPTVALGLTLSVLRRGLTSMARIQEIVTAAPAAEPPGPPLAQPPSIRFRGLTFAYPGREPALRDIDFEVAPGEVVAVVGPTGSGKTTLGMLLSRLWTPPPGTVFVAGHDVTAVPLGTLRATVGWVPQDAFLFSRSIHDNLTLGRDGLDGDAARAAAAEAAVAAEVEAFPEGYQTVVGERGLTVSGGQRQRLALARALVGAPRLLVLDDVFASVDAVTEERILAALRASGRTMLVITHRLRVAQVADRVIVLDGGRIVERGRHAALLAGGGLYARLWRMQQLEEEIARA
jgi:ATP-binding cassette subfamily B protein